MRVVEVHIEGMQQTDFSRCLLYSYACSLAFLDTSCCISDLWPTFFLLLVSFFFS